MRILYIDIDTLRPDHLGCYGYHRRTSPNIDRVASQGVRFDKCYVSDAPCLPSRASMFSGQFGIHNGAVGHGDTAADLRIIGPGREFHSDQQRTMFIPALRRAGLYPVSFSSFAERHSAWWFCAGWREMHNCGKRGHEIADEVAPAAIEWIGRNAAQRDGWMLHVHVWDPHGPYRAPEAFGNPFDKEPVAPWYTEERRKRQWDGFGPGSPQEWAGSYGSTKESAREPAQVRDMAAYKKVIDGYDCGVAYADLWVGRILAALEKAGVMEDTAIVITSDHGENLGELNVIADHATADHITSRVPMIVRWPGLKGGRVDDALHYQTDAAATILELAGGAVPGDWDGRSFAPAMKQGRSEGRPYVVFSQMAWSCQRAVRWGDNVFIRSYHTGLKDYPARMLFDVAADPHETNNLAPSQAALADHGQALIEQWTAEMMASSKHEIDPLWTVMREGGPLHAGRRQLERYCQRLRDTGRAQHAEFLEKNPTGIAEQ